MANQSFGQRMAALKAAKTNGGAGAKKTVARGRGMTKPGPVTAKPVKKGVGPKGKAVTNFKQFKKAGKK